MSTSAALANLAGRLALILSGLKHTLAGRMAADRAFAPLLILLWARLHRAADRFTRLTRCVAVGQVLVRRDRPSGHSGPPNRLPRGVAWLIRLVPEAAAFGAQLQALMADPAMASLLAAAPQAGRILRPLCRMLAVPTVPALARPAPRKRTAPPPPARVVAPTADPTPAAAPPLSLWHEFFAPA